MKKTVIVIVVDNLGDDDSPASPKFKIIKKDLEDIRKYKTQLTQPIGSIEHNKSTTSMLACESF